MFGKKPKVVVNKDHEEEIVSGQRTHAASQKKESAETLETAKALSEIMKTIRSENNFMHDFREALGGNR